MSLNNDGTGSTTASTVTSYISFFIQVHKEWDDGQAQITPQK